MGAISQLSALSQLSDLFFFTPFQRLDLAATSCCPQKDKTAKRRCVLVYRYSVATYLRVYFSYGRANANGTITSVSQLSEILHFCTILAAGCISRGNSTSRLPVLRRSTPSIRREHSTRSTNCYTGLKVPSLYAGAKISPRAPRFAHFLPTSERQSVLGAKILTFGSLANKKRKYYAISKRSEPRAVRYKKLSKYNAGDSTPPGDNCPTR